MHWCSLDCINRCVLGCLFVSNVLTVLFGERVLIQLDNIIINIEVVAIDFKNFVFFYFFCVTRARILMLISYIIMACDSVLHLEVKLAILVFVCCNFCLGILFECGITPNFLHLFQNFISYFYFFNGICMRSDNRYVTLNF